MTGALLVAGTSSDAGKSVLVAGLCRWLHRQGVAVAPFKAQNMSLNSAVTEGGEEIGRAQAMQAAAAGIAPEAAMNPVLLKPATDRASQVIVMGHPSGGPLEAAAYQERAAALRPVVLEALASLRRRFAAVICEGAGGAAEINLRERDLANLGIARAAGLPVVLVSDIERGGVFAALFGSLALLDPEDQAHIRGFVINRFRGDPALLEPGVRELERRTGRPVLGVLPWVSGLEVDAEDSLALGRLPAPIPPVGRGEWLSVAVVRLPRLSNFTDVDPLAVEPGVHVRFTAAPAEVATADLAIVPGTKATVADLVWLHQNGLADALRERAGAGRPTLGICGGYQMLGRSVTDGVESTAGPVPGLGLLPVATEFAPAKILGRRTGQAPGFGDAVVTGYEIRHGRVRREGAEPLFTGDEGCHSGVIAGTSWHGLFEEDGFRRRFLGWVAGAAGRRWCPGDRPFAGVREARLDVLGDLVARHLDTAAVMALLTAPPAPPPPPVVARLRPC